MLRLHLMRLKEHLEHQQRAHQFGTKQVIHCSLRICWGQPGQLRFHSARCGSLARDFAQSMGLFPGAFHRAARLTGGLNSNPTLLQGLHPGRRERLQHGKTMHDPALKTDHNRFQKEKWRKLDSTAQSKVTSRFKQCAVCKATC
jgi:hypothetical protein